MRTLTGLLFLSLALGQIPSPQDVFGDSWGTRFTPHHEALDYLETVAERSAKVALETYGYTYEGRPLVVVYLGTPEQITRRAEIAAHNRRRAGLAPGPVGDDDPVIVWLTYNIHGNEASSLEAALLTVYELATRPAVETGLDSVLVILDPCANPDGRDRYANWQRQVGNIVPDPDPAGREHGEDWPGSRSNHYYFDLNRDWIWQRQTESQARNRLYNRWLPQIHVDFHEQGVDEPYYFPPAAEPVHEQITPWQRKLEAEIGQANAAYFDAAGWLYFRREEFDLLYPGYGDTYPFFQGAVGLTYEQAGGRRAGRAVHTATGDTLRLQDRIRHHLATGLNTIRFASRKREPILAEFAAYFQNSATRGAYLIPAATPSALKDLASWLAENQIRSGTPARVEQQKGLRFGGENETVILRPGDLVIPLAQPKSRLIQVLFEPQTRLSDSLTYDLTAWALPYVYNLPAWKLKKTPPLSPYSPPERQPLAENKTPYGYAVDWNQRLADAFLARLLQKDMVLRYATEPFVLGQDGLPRGSLIILQADNEKKNHWRLTVEQAARETGINLWLLTSGAVSQGRDLGSGTYRVISPPRIALIGGSGLDPSRLGEVWYYLEQELHYPVTVLLARDLEQVSLTAYDVIILPTRNRRGYGDSFITRLAAWVTDGGTLIALGRALEDLADGEHFHITEVKKDSAATPAVTLKSYGHRRREGLKRQNYGAIVKVHLDPTHPLAFGYDTTYYALKQNATPYAWLTEGWNVGVVNGAEDIVSGFVGAEARPRLVRTLILGVEDKGRGHVIYLADSPLFRGFWSGGKKLMTNALFFFND